MNLVKFFWAHREGYFRLVGTLVLLGVMSLFLAVGQSGFTGILALILKTVYWPMHLIGILGIPFWLLYWVIIYTVILKIIGDNGSLLLNRSLTKKPRGSLGLSTPYNYRAPLGVIAVVIFVSGLMALIIHYNFNLIAVWQTLEISGSSCAGNYLSQACRLKWKGGIVLLFFIILIIVSVGIRLGIIRDK